MAELVLDLERQRVLDLVESGKNVFLTGKAGTGKSTLSRHILATTKRKILPVGSTGIAAINIGGQTAHSAFKIRPGMTPAQIKKSDHPSMEIFSAIDAVMIDEQSMIRADFMDCLDRSARLHGRYPDRPFGGIQLIGVGDLCQLPPVVTEDEEERFRTEYEGPYFFHAHCYPSLDMHYIELERVFRQKDPTLVDVLNKLRLGEATPTDLRVLNARYDPDFDLGNYPEHVYLAMRNRVVDQINHEKLAALPGNASQMNAIVTGNFPKGGHPVDQFLTLKVGARVMLLNNDRNKRWVNGDIGTITEIGQFSIVVDIARAGPMRIERHIWESVEQVYNKEEDKLEPHVVGTFMQYPVRLAWAITAHKSQGQTFNTVAVDLSGGTFAHGQAYVALSRCTSLPGLVMKKKITMKDVMFDPRVRAFIMQAKQH